jgi:WhiB family redox-sensing transcriptional regulator
VSWRDEAACIGLDSDTFFYQESTGAAAKMARAAKAICKTCPVLRECGDYAIRTKQPNGIWGGMSERQRQQVRTMKDLKIA